ncbi:hypothetical protein G6L37_03280 [Agrobacterium rubi]|nr:hypothetical protein [Agrobacterium rubi]NTF24398.1 hypothetical protein [Agrobacterium rubi]
MPSKPNIVEILDRIVALHGPVFADLLKQYPEASGISGYLEPHNVRAIPEDEDGRGYRDEDFGSIAAPALKSIAPETCEIIGALGIKGRYPPQFRVNINRGDDGKVHFEAMINDGLGAVLVKRNAVVFEKHGYGFFCYPAILATMAFSEHKEEIDNVVFASKRGFGEALDFMIELDLVHNQKWHKTQVVRKFAKLFPTDGIAQINRMGKESLWLMTRSTHQPYKLMASAAAREEMEGNSFEGAEFETLEPRDCSPRFVH